MRCMGPTSIKNEDRFCVSFVSEMKMRAVSSVLPNTCSYCVILFPAALQWVTVNFLEKILSAVACAGSYNYFFLNRSCKIYV